MNGGYASLIDLTLRTVTPDGVKRDEIITADDYVATLKTHFALDLPEATILWPVMRTRHEAYMRESAARRADDTRTVTQ